jgi:hypothetical protein
MTPDEADTRDELDQITDAIREALAQGRFIPGELLPVPQLVQQFGTNAYEMVRALLPLVVTSYLIIVPDQGHQGDNREPAAELAAIPVRCPNCSGTLNAALCLSAG